MSLQNQFSMYDSMPHSTLLEMTAPNKTLLYAIRRQQTDFDQHQWSLVSGELYKGPRVSDHDPYLISQMTLPLILMQLNAWCMRILSLGPLEYFCRHGSLGAGIKSIPMPFLYFDHRSTNLICMCSLLIIYGCILLCMTCN